MLWFLVTLVGWSALCMVAAVLVLRVYCSVKRGSKVYTVAFFHPYCNDGGGGERVLWCGIRALQYATNDNVHVVVYTGDSAEKAAILNKAKGRFGVTFPRDIEFVRLTQRKWIEKERWPYFTILGQSIGSMILGLEALLRHPPSLFIDSMGYAFTFPIFRWLGGCDVTCYVHYPTVSTDMIKKATRPGLKGLIQPTYYKLYAFMYGWAGRFAKTVFVNSGWTKAHIDEIWGMPRHTSVIFPPCDTSSLVALPLAWENRCKEAIIISVGQFREEKDHPLQVTAFAKLLTKLQNSTDKDVTQFAPRLVLIGSCREDEPKDKERLAALKVLAKKLGVEDRVSFEVGISFKELQQNLGRAMIGLHTMWCEHFGIGVVEMMAAGVITIAHNSGGPAVDIIDRPGQTGYLATTADEYCDRMYHVLKTAHTTTSTTTTTTTTTSGNEQQPANTSTTTTMTSSCPAAMQADARESVQRFSDAAFDRHWTHRCVKTLIPTQWLVVED
eukprot:TRINITY_DN1433_c1_g1_i1.p1 TRINITY_DN1433_c1_g1~~TRINITY_DN1433_c1_g1_i1.p1  ORF type:complete len:498 (-),score=73.11 TRINITY_DN1433_c1_g1_i1:64-1557(-)